MKHPLHLGNLLVGPAPLVVGVISTEKALQHILDLEEQPFDVAEFRMDLIGVEATEWLQTIHLLNHRGYPTILTLRHPHEGGHWYREETERLKVYQEALPFVGAVDAEISSSIFPTLSRAARAAGKVAIGSYHDFAQTPDRATLESVVEAGVAHGASIVKIATFIQSESDILLLTDLLRSHADKHLCLLGMGPLGMETRITFPLAGSCLTYGFVDQSSAPGQLSSAKLRERLTADSGAYRELAKRRSGK